LYNIWVLVDIFHDLSPIPQKMSGENTFFAIPCWRT